ncbi:MAG: hypothetical protein IBX57_00230 [Gammaproteobacteria bacterium]|nr:hypothetical protein [Gammaproteobacteria bacterium]
MSVVNARDIYNLTKDKVWRLPEGKMSLKFDDGVVIETTNRATVFSWYLGVYHRMYPKTPLLARHHLGDRQIGKNTHLDILGDALFDAVDAYNGSLNMEELSLKAYQLTNEIYNDFTTRLKAYVSTITILDFLDALEHPEIKKANSEVKPTQLSIDQTYQAIGGVLKRDGELVGNTVSRMAKSGLVSMGQILQCVGPRGYLTDIDSNIFRKPVLTGYAQGVNLLYDSMIESRSASKALMFAKDPVAESEYFNRQMQLMASIVTRVHEGDCGSNEYILFKVRSSDLQKITGKYYLDETDKKLKEVRAGDRHLVGQLLKFRSPLKCKHSDSYGVCSTCYGALHKSLPLQTNVGHISATVLCEKISQNVLSTKHLDGSSKVDDFEISDYDSRYIRSESNVIDPKDGGEGGTVIKLSERLKGAKIKMTLVESQARNLSDIEYHKVEALAPSQITSLTEVAFTLENKEGFTETVTIPVSMGSRFSWLTFDALKYVKEKGWHLSSKGNYVIDLTDWDNDLPLFQLPLKHTDMVQYMKTIKRFVIHAGKPYRGPDSKTIKPVVDRKLIDFYNLISSKLSVNLVSLEIIMLSAMIRSEADRDFRLPRPVTSGELGSYDENMGFRSMGVSMAYQAQSRRLTDTRSFTIRTRPDSLFDNLLLPFPHANPRD